MSVATNCWYIQIIVSPFSWFLFPIVCVRVVVCHEYYVEITRFSIENFQYSSVHRRNWTVTTSWFLIKFRTFQSSNICNTCISSWNYGFCIDANQIRLKAIYFNDIQAEQRLQRLFLTKNLHTSTFYHLSHLTHWQLVEYRIHIIVCFQQQSSCTFVNQIEISCFLEQVSSQALNKLDGQNCEKIVWFI